MALTFITGRSGTGKSTMVYKKIIKESMEHPNTNYLIIVPEQYTLAIQKEIIKLHPRHCIMNIDILSFNRLAYRVFDELGMELKEPLADTGKNMIIRKIVENNKDLLGAYGRNYNKQGFISEIKSFISELYQYSITPDFIEKFINENPNDRSIVNKLKEILLIYKEFEKFLGERYITAEGISDALANVISQSHMIKQSVVCMDGFTGFTPSQMKLVTKLMELSTDIFVTLTIDPECNNFNEASLFYLTYKTKQKLTAVAKEIGININKDIVHSFDEKLSVRSKEMEFLEKAIFKYPVPVYDKKVENIKICSMANAREEISNVADEIAKLVSQGYRYKDIAVVCADMDNFADISKQVFTKKGIPVFIDQKKNVNDNLYIEFINAAMEIVTSSYSYDAMFRFIRCKLYGMDKEEADILENYALAAGINNKTKWGKMWSSQFRINYEDRMEYINELRQRVYDDTKKFKNLFKPQGTIEEYVSSIRKINENFECGRKLAIIADSFANDAQYAYEKEYAKIYEQIEALLEQMEQLLGNTQVELDEFIKIFEAGVNEIKIGIIPQTTDQVVVGDIERSRLNDISIVFIVGTNDGVIPKMTSSTKVMSEIERQRLLDLGFEISPTRRQATFIGQFYLYSNITKPSKKLYISYSRMGNDANQLNPSYLIAQILRIFPSIEIISKREMLREDGRDYMMERLSQRERKPLDSKWNQILSWNVKKDEDLQKGNIEKIINAAFDDKADIPLDKNIANELYDSRSYSISRIEKFASCAYAHFLEYGLGLRKRDEYQLMLPDMGIMFHEIMENFSEELKLRQLGWDNLTKEQCDTIMEECVNKTSDAFENGILHDSNRSEFMIKQIKRIAKRTGWTLSRHVALSKFTPTGFEVKFSKTIGNNDDKLNGIIDRLDICKEGDKNYLKIIDYKSSEKSFDTALFREGISMQLIVYMDAAVNGGFLKEAKNKIPAGAFFYNFTDPIADNKDGLIEIDDSTNEIKYIEGNILPELFKKLKMTGIINEQDDILQLLDSSISINDKNKFLSESIDIRTDNSKLAKYIGMGMISTEQFNSLLEYSSTKVDDINCEIVKGNIERNPYQYNEKKSCDYCNFNNICRYSAKVNQQYRHIHPIKFDTFLDELKCEPEEENDNGMD